MYELSNAPTALSLAGVAWTVPLSFALTGPVAGAIGTRETLIGAGIVGAVGTFVFLYLPGMRDTERDEEFTLSLRISKANRMH